LTNDARRLPPANLADDEQEHAERDDRDRNRSDGSEQSGSVGSDRGNIGSGVSQTRASRATHQDQTSDEFTHFNESPPFFTAYEPAE